MTWTFEVIMNPVALRFTEVIVAVAICALLFALAARAELVQRVRETIAWLLKVSFFDFIKLLIFVKPWKPYSQLIGVLVWLVLVYITGRYMIVTQPRISDISGPYSPMIGYVYYLSLLFVVGFVLYATGKMIRRD